MANTTSWVEEGFGKRLSETSREKGVSIIDACMIEGDKACEADVIEEVATKDDIESEVAMNKSMADGRGKTLPTLILETSVVVFENQRETEVTGGGDKKGKVRSRFGWKMIRTEFRSERKPNRAKEDSAERRPERKPNQAKEDSTERQLERKPNRAKEDSAER